MKITRCTTPTLTFTLPIELYDADRINIIFSQRPSAFAKEAVPIVVKTKEQCNIAGKIITLTLTESDTAKLNEKEPLEIQIKYSRGQTVGASDIIQTDVGKILKDGWA